MFLDGIKAWFPDTDQPPVKATELQKQAMMLLYDIMEESISTVSKNQWGEWPSIHPFFNKQHQIQQKAPEYNFEWLLGWLMKPRFFQYQARHGENAELWWRKERVAIVAKFVATWYFVVNGIGKQRSLDDAQRRYGDLIISTIKQTYPGNEISTLVATWRKQAKRMLYTPPEGYTGTKSHRDQQLGEAYQALADQILPEPKLKLPHRNEKNGFWAQLEEFLKGAIKRITG